MTHYSDEKILAVCKLRFDKDNAEKTHTCTLTETKLYIARGSDLKNISLQDISSIEYTKRVNWKLIGFGLVVLLFAWANYAFGMFPSKPEYTGTGSVTIQKNWLAQSDEKVLHGLNPQPQSDEKVLHGLNPQPQAQTDASDELPPLDSIVKNDNPVIPINPNPSMEDDLEWVESKNNISMAIAMIGGILIYFGLKKKSFIHIITNRENIYLRVYIVTEEYESFVNLLNNKIGYVGVKK